MENNLKINIEKLFPEVKRFNYMMGWYRKSRNVKTRIKIIKHCVKIANSLGNGKWKFKVKVLKK